MPVITGFESLNFRAVATIYHRLKRSSSNEERGLKLSKLALYPMRNPVAPHAGAWIETGLVWVLGA